MSLDFVESTLFTRQSAGLLPDVELSALQAALRANPEMGTKLGGGLFKIRWGAEGRGKHGGVRIIYAVRTAAGRIVLLAIYAKNEAESMTPDQMRRLRELAGD